MNIPFKILLVAPDVLREEESQRKSYEGDRWNGGERQVGRPSSGTKPATVQGTYGQPSHGGLLPRWTARGTLWEGGRVRNGIGR